MQYFKFHVNTGSVKPICCQQHQYVKHEPEVLIYLDGYFKQNNLMYRYWGPWVSLVIIVSKPAQEKNP